MPKLPSPIPHPLSFLDAPGWLREALEWVVGVDWPTGDEKAMRRLADAWQEAGRQVGPLLEESDRAALEAVAALGGPEGEAAQALLALWRRLGGGPEAVLSQVNELFDALGEFVDGTANDIEGVKLEFYIELLLMLAELLILVATAAVTGGASLAGAGPIMMATRFAIQRILRRAASQIIKRAVKKAMRDKMKDLAGDRLKAGVARFGLRTMREGMEEGLEELGTTAATQGYQISEGNLSGLDHGELVRSFGVGTLAGSVANVTSLGGIRAGGAVGEFGERSLRGAAGEVLADVTVGVVTGQGVTWTSMGMAATSGTAGSMVGAGQHALDGRLGLSHDVVSDAVSDAVSGRFGAAEAAAGSGEAAAGSGVTAAGEAAVGSGLMAAGVTEVAAGSGVEAEVRPEPGAARIESHVGLEADLHPEPEMAQAGNRVVAEADLHGSSAPQTAALSGGPTATVTAVPVTGPTDALAPTTPAGPSAPVLPSQPTAGPPSPAPSAPGLPSQAVAGSPSPVPSAPQVRAAQPHALTPPDTARPPDPAGSVSFEPFLVVTSTATPESAKPFVPEIRPGVPAALVDDPHIRKSYSDYIQIEIQRALKTRLMEFVDTLVDRTDSPRRRQELSDYGVSALTQADIRPIADELWTISNIVYRNTNWGFTTSGINDTSTISLATGRDVPPVVESTRRYGQPGTYNPPLSKHQQDVEFAVPRDADGVPLRFADLRGDWLRLVNDGGPNADLCRAINCADVVLSLLDTWMHGRPRVAAPRTYDSFTLDDLLRPLSGEVNGAGRIEATTGGTFQQFESDREGFLGLEAVLREAGHGSCAVLIQQRPDGTVHASTVHNQNGEILYVDAQNPSAALTGRPVGALQSNIIVLRQDSAQIDLGTPPGIWSTLGAPDPEGAPSAWSAPGVDPELMFRDPTREQLEALGVGNVTAADLGLADADLTPAEHEQLSRVAMINPRELGFTQRSVSAATSDGVAAADLERRLATDGWRGGPVHVVLWGDGSLASLDHRRVRAATRANLPGVPAVVHPPSDPVTAWGDRGETLVDDLRRLPNDSWVVGGDEGTIVYPKGTLPQTCGQAAVFRAATQRSLLPGALFGTHRLPVTIGKPPGPLPRIVLSLETEDDLRRVIRAAEIQADAVQSYLESLGFPLRKLEHRLKTFDSLARKYGNRDDRFGAGSPSPPKDVLRFTLELPDGRDYAASLRHVIESMTGRGHLPVSVKNFWAPGNRFHGVNATFEPRTGEPFEVQFGTTLSLRADTFTHEIYEIMRRNDELEARRVHSLLWMLSINKRIGLPNTVPEGVAELYPSTDNGLAKWISANPMLWDTYLEWLTDNLRGLGGIVNEFELDGSDFPVSPRRALTLREADIGVLRALRG